MTKPEQLTKKAINTILSPYIIDGLDEVSKKNLARIIFDKPLLDLNKTLIDFYTSTHSYDSASYVQNYAIINLLIEQKQLLTEQKQHNQTLIEQNKEIISLLKQLVEK